MGKAILQDGLSRSTGPLMDSQFLPAFNPRPRIQPIRIGPDDHAYVIDDVLLNPERMVELAQLNRHQFKRPPVFAYPGLELGMPADFSSRLDEFFRQHIRRLLGGRRTLRMSCRLSMVSFTPQELAPRQWSCHRDLDDAIPGECIAASVLYLFKDSQLGGTSFYLPKRSPAETNQLVRDAVAMEGPEFTRRYAVAQGYMVDSNEYFERTCTLPAQWNRMVFYNGAMFHSGAITAPQSLNDDPQTGRLTLNGFFASSSKAT